MSESWLAERAAWSAASPLARAWDVLQRGQHSGRRELSIRQGTNGHAQCYHSSPAPTDIHARAAQCPGSAACIEPPGITEIERVVSSSDIGGSIPGSFSPSRVLGQRMKRRDWTCDPKPQIKYGPTLKTILHRRQQPCPHRRRPPLTSIPVRLHAVSVLQSATPGALVPGRCVQALPDPVPALEPVSPLSPVYPPSLVFYAESVALPLRPVALEHVPAGPGVDPDHLEAVGPRARVLALALGTGAHTLAVGFAFLPASATRGGGDRGAPGRRAAPGGGVRERGAMAAGRIGGAVTGTGSGDVGGPVTITEERDQQVPWSSQIGFIK
ncbi:hypothetical protein EYF80_031657 [Liparis tanakae]|uniref:Uncharacterized protein n=1 Tax=Liparis tanakae TaxID=230148 RepID=A0A4Z2GZV9_9TELE|nr:hypothetical protein EYF80_031657 [Liparis tanakae]